MGVDPGTNTGVSIYEVDCDLNIVSVETHTIDLNMFVDQDSNQHVKDADRYLALGNLISELLEKYNPVGAAVESSFINVKFQSSGMKVAAYISVVLYALKRHNKDILICKLAPKQIKKFMGDATANKDTMKSLLSDKLVFMVGEEVAKLVNAQNLTEHTIDAIAIGYNFLEVIRKAPYLLNR